MQPIKQSRRMTLLFVVVMLIAVSGVISIQGSGQGQAQVSPVSQAIPVDGMLSEATLRQYGLEVAKLSASRSGEVFDLSTEELNAAPAAFSTWQEWLTFNNGDTEPEPGDLGVENRGRPVFIIQIAGSAFRPFVGLPPTPRPDGIEPTPAPSTMIQIVLWADTGVLHEIIVFGVGATPLDLNALRAISSVHPDRTRIPADTVPLPTPENGTIPLP